MEGSSPSSSGRPTGFKIPSILRKATTLDSYRELLERAGVVNPNEAGLALLVIQLAQGTLSSNQFSSRISSEFQLSPAVAQGVAKGVCEKVLAGIAGQLPFVLEELTQDSSTSQKAIIEDDTADEEELAQIKQQKAAVLQAKGPLDIQGIVKEICENPAFQFQDATLQERCAKLIESRVRDVRTPEQTRAQLEKSVDKGGLGVTGRRLSDMLAFIEGRVAAYQGNLSQEEQRKRAQQRAVIPNKAELAKKEETLLTKKYIQLTGKVPGAHVAPVAPSVSRTSVAISAHHEQIAREGKIDAGKVKQAIQGAQEAAVAPRPTSTPIMQEVTFEKRLSGPIDELRSLTLTDFRRLSKDPVKAATHIKDKVDLMEEQGYGKKVEAIQAWRASPLNQLYASLTRDALLSGTSVAELLRGKRTAGEDTLTDEELKVMMQLNAELRF